MLRPSAEQPGRLVYPASCTSPAWLAADALQFTAAQAGPSSPAALQAISENVAVLQAASDVNSPVTGTVKEVNEALNDEPNKVAG